MLPLLGSNLSGITIGVTGYALHWSAGDFGAAAHTDSEGGLPTTLIVIALFVAVQKSLRIPILK